MLLSQSLQKREGVHVLYLPVSCFSLLEETQTSWHFHVTGLGLPKHLDALGSSQFTSQVTVISLDSVDFTFDCIARIVTSHRTVSI